MANSTAYVQTVAPNGGAAEHQTSPHWVLTFVRWAERDTFRTKPQNGIDYKTVRSNALVVESDCIQVSTTMNKGTLTPNMQATLLFTDINYLTAIAPGDFCFVNMLNWGDAARKIRNKAEAYQAINGVNDGFKGLFKVQSVRQRLMTDPASGHKTVVFHVTGFGFTEFNNTIYFNQNLIDANMTRNIALYVSNIGNAWANVVGKKGFTNVQDLMKALVEILIGSGVALSGQKDKEGNLLSANLLFMMPGEVGKLLGVPDAKAAKDIYTYLFGIQKYGNAGTVSFPAGMNPSNISKKNSRMLLLKDKCQGETTQPGEYWNMVKMWSIMNQFTNAPLNEMFTAFRVDPNGSIMPTVVFRQIPFTNDSFNASNIPVTRFMNLPRWQIDPALILAKDIGRDETARVNFVQAFGRSTFGVPGFQSTAETAMGNYQFDVDDVKRSGLRPVVAASLLDEMTEDKNTFLSPVWARIIGDALMGGHLKLSGTIQCAGIEDPICVGDNLVDDGVVYHIESVTHSCAISIDGRKQFRTTFNLSSGISIDSDKNGVKYAQMDCPNGYAFRENADTNLIYPGISESQNSSGRTSVDKTPPLNEKNVSFVQPNTTTSINKKTRS